MRLARASGWLPDAALGNGVGRKINHFAVDHRRETLIERSQSNEGVLPGFDVSNLVRANSSLDHQFVVGGKQFKNVSTRSDDAPDGLLVELDNRPADRNTYVSSLDYVLHGANLLDHIVGFRLGAMQFLNRLLICGRPQLHDLLLCPRDSFLCVPDSSE